MKTAASTDVTNHFIEQMGLITQADGLPRIAGKIFGLLLLESGSFSFAEIAERLTVSRGSVSTNTRLLENLGLIVRTAKMGERGDYFQLAEKPYTRLLEGVSRRMHRSACIVAETRNALPDSMGETRQRLAELEKFFSEYLDSTKTLMERLASQ